MTSYFQVLQIIADGDTHSGQKLSKTLGVSRAAIWKHIQKLESLGIDISKEQSKGYRLETPIEFLDHKKIISELTDGQRKLLRQLFIEKVVDSTNTLAAQGIADELSGSVWLAEQQTAGRGRRGRNWVSPFGANIYLSVLWKISGGAAQLGGLSLALGVALVEALREQGVYGLTLKWPNDLLYERKKVGGILVEIQGDAAGDCHVVAGIGLNINMSGRLADSIDREWADLNSICPALPGRNQIAAALVGAVLELLDCYPATGFTGYVGRWNALDGLRDAAATVHIGAETIDGIARGVAEDGSLQLETATGIRSILGGEVSLRAQM